MSKFKATLTAAALALGLGTGVVYNAAEFIGPKEALRTVPYKDIGGVTTWCYGQTVGTPKAQYTAQECAEDLLEAVQVYWDGIRQYVPEEAPESVKAAMVSVAYNVGISGWAWEFNARGQRVPSRFRVALAAGDWEATCYAIQAPWQGRHGVAQGYKATVQGKPVRGLENRRWAEYRLCMRDVQ